VTLQERPIQGVTLVSAAKAALRARLRQSSLYASMAYAASANRFDPHRQIVEPKGPRIMTLVTTWVSEGRWAQHPSDPRHPLGVMGRRVGRRAILRGRAQIPGTVRHQMDHQVRPVRDPYHRLRDQVAGRSAHRALRLQAQKDGHEETEERRPRRSDRRFVAPAGKRRAQHVPKERLMEILRGDTIAASTSPPHPGRL
jgi:hypothetical protein